MSVQRVIDVAVREAVADARRAALREVLNELPEKMPSEKQYRELREWLEREVTS